MLTNNGFNRLIKAVNEANEIYELKWEDWNREIPIEGEEKTRKADKQEVSCLLDDQNPRPSMFTNPRG